MKKLLFLAAFVVFGLSATQPANADWVLLDDFEDTGNAIDQVSNVVGTSLALTTNTGSATNRVLIGSATPAFQVTLGNLSATVLSVFEQASIIWEFAAPQAVSGLALHEYVATNMTGVPSFEIFFNGDGTPGTGDLAGAGFLPTVPDGDGFGLIGAQNAANDVTRLELRITNNGPGITLFSTSAISATPEPASMGLLALALCGGIGWRRKRKALAC